MIVNFETSTYEKYVTSLPHDTKVDKLLGKIISNPTTKKKVTDLHFEFNSSDSIDKKYNSFYAKEVRNVFIREKTRGKLRYYKITTSTD